MIKIKKFESSMFCPNPNKAMEKFIEKNGISKEKILSINSGSVPIAKGRMVCNQITLTYEE